MSLSFKSLSSLPNQNTLTGSFRLPAHTGPAGYENLTLSALQSYINAPMITLIEEVGQNSGPSIWPAKRTLTLTGGATGTVQLDGSQDVSLATTVNSANITYGNNTIPQAAITGLGTRLSDIDTKLGWFSIGPNGLTAPLTLNRGGDDMLYMRNGTAIYGVLGGGGGAIYLGTQENNNASGEMRRLRFRNNGRLDFTSVDDTVIHSYWDTGTYNPATFNAASASKLQAARTITYTGAASATLSFDGSSNQTVNLRQTSFSTNSSQADNTGPWTRLLRLPIAVLYGDCSVDIEAIGSGDGSVNMRSTRLRARVKQQTAPPAAPYVNLEIDRTSYLTITDATLVVNHAAFPVTADLYVRLNGTYNGLKWAVVSSSGNQSYEAFSNEPFTTTLPTGTNITQFPAVASKQNWFGDTFAATTSMSIAGNAVWHAGTFNPANYSQVGHKHDASDITTGALNFDRVNAGRILQNDGVAMAPGAMDNAWRFHQRTLTDQGLTGAGWATVLTMTPGSSASTWPDHQLTFSSVNGSLYRRTGTRAGGWGPQYRVMDESWFDPASPVPVGKILQVGASAAAGTRFDNLGQLSLNNGAFAKILTTADMSPSSYVTVTQNAASYSNADDLYGKLAHAVSGSTAMGSPNPYMTTWNLGTNGGRDGQLSWNYAEVDRLYFRHRVDTTNAWRPWVELWHTGNFDPATFQPNLPARLGVGAAIVTDWNSAATNGWYMASDAANAPSAGWWLGMVTVHNSDWIQQEVWPFTAAVNSPRFRRYRSSGTWGSWTSDVTYGAVTGTRFAAGFNPGTDNSIGCSNWFRSSGQTGLYFADFGGGVFMQDTTYVRTYQNKAFAASWFETTFTTHTPNTSADACGFRTSGNYGGGYGLKDGAAHLSIFSVGGNMTFGFGQGSIQYHRYVMQADGLMLAGDYGLTSDERQKSYMTPLEYRGRLEPLQYMWSDTGKWDLGFGAQTTMRRYREAVHYEVDTDTYRLKPMKLIAVLAAQANINEDRIIVLEAENRDLREKLDRVMAHLGLE